MPSDSDSSEDDNNQKLKDAIDTNFFNDDMFSNNAAKKIVNVKSNRYMDTKSQHSDINVGVDMQKRVGEKLSKIIGNIVKFVDIDDNNLNNDLKYDGIKLFSNSENFINPDALAEDISQEPRKKIKKRIIEEDATWLSKEERIKISVVSPKYVIEKCEIKHWKSRKKPKIYNYFKSKHGNILTLKD